MTFPTWCPASLSALLGWAFRFEQKGKLRHKGRWRQSREQESEGKRRKKKHLLALLLFSFIFKLFPDQTRRGITEKKGIRIRKEPCENVYPSNMCKLAGGRAHDVVQPWMQPGVMVSHGEVVIWGCAVTEFLRNPQLFIYTQRQLSLYTSF